MDVLSTLVKGVNSYVNTNSEFERNQRSEVLEIDQLKNGVNINFE